MEDAEFQFADKEPCPPIDVDPQAVLAFTQTLRFRRVHENTQNGKVLPADFGETMELLKQMDNSALTTRKLNIEEKAGTNARTMLDAYDRLIEAVGDGVLRSDNKGPIPVAQRLTSPLEGTHLPVQPRLAIGEDAQGEVALNVADFLPAEQ